MTLYSRGENGDSWTRSVLRGVNLRLADGQTMSAQGLAQAGGSTLVWFGLTWSLELYQQANARLWRQGQKAETVVIHHIITKDTIDERILSALQKKDKTQSALIDAVKANLEVQP